MKYSVFLSAIVGADVCVCVGSQLSLCVNLVELRVLYNTRCSKLN